MNKTILNWKRFGRDEIKRKMGLLLEIAQFAFRFVIKLV